MDTNDVTTLRKLCKAKKKRRDKLLEDKRIQKLIREVAYNLLDGRIHLTANRKKYLMRKASDVRKLAKKSTSHRNRLRITQQRGGFLSAILLPALATLASSLFKR